MSHETRELGLEYNPMDTVIPSRRRYCGQRLRMMCETGADRGLAFRSSATRHHVLSKEHLMWPFRI